MSLSLVRIFPRSHAKHRVAAGVTIVLALIYISSLIAVGFGCNVAKPDSCLVPTTAPEDFGNNFGFTADLFGDIVLLALPLYLLWRLKLNPKDRRVVLAAFSGSILTLCGVVTVMVFVYGPFPMTLDTKIVTNMAFHIEAATGLLACNLFVISTFVYRAIKNSRKDNNGNDRSNGHRKQENANERGRRIPGNIEGSPDSKNLNNTTDDTGRLTYVNLTKISTMRTYSDSVSADDEEHGAGLEEDEARSP